MLLDDRRAPARPLAAVCVCVRAGSMTATLIELVVLAFLSAFLCGTAFSMGHITAAAIFAVLAGIVVVAAAGLWKFS
jgi:hypothetical protein